MLSAWRSFWGNDTSNEPDEELIDEEVNADDNLTSSRGALTEIADGGGTSGGSILQGKGGHERSRATQETRFMQNTCHADFSEERQVEIRDMIAEITSRETGYYSSDIDSDSFENISLDNQPIDNSETETEAKSNIPNFNIRTLSPEDLQIEYDINRSALRNISQSNMPCQTSSSINKPSTSQAHTSVVDNSIYSLPCSSQRSSAPTHKHSYSNKAFADDELTATDSSSPSQPKAVTFTQTPQAAQSRWTGLSTQKKSIILRSNVSDSNNALHHNPAVVTALTDSYARAKNRLQQQRPSKWETFQKVHVKRVIHALQVFKDGHDDHKKNKVFRKHKYYDIESDEEDILNMTYDPYSGIVRKQPWWRKKSKTASHRLKKYKFFGKALK